jgi:hypothetical protein
MCAEASTVLRAVAADFFFNCWYLKIPSDNRIRHIPRCVHYHAQRLSIGNVLEIRIYFDEPPSSLVDLYRLSNVTVLKTRRNVRNSECFLTACWNYCPKYFLPIDLLCVRVHGYRSRGPGSIPGATRFSEK